MLYRIETRYSYGWDDAGWTEEVEGIITPMRFRSMSEAEEAIDEFFAEVHAAVLAGNLDSENVRNDYRIIRTTE